MIVRRGEELHGEAPDSHKMHIEKMTCKEAQLRRSCSPASGATAQTEEMDEIARIETWQVFGLYPDSRRAPFQGGVAR